MGSTLADLRTAFAGYRIEEHFKADFGQGTNGVIINDQDGAIAFSVADAPAVDYASGRVEISYINCVGVRARLHQRGRRTLSGRRRATSTDATAA